MDLSLVPYIQSLETEKTRTTAAAKYRECLRNHAAAMGGQAYDGCGEFMASEEDPLRCAACGCHRNFHRREGFSSHQLLGLNIGKPAMVPSPTPVSFFSPPPLPFHQIPPPETGRGGSETPPRRDEGMMRKKVPHEVHRRAEAEDEDLRRKARMADAEARRRSLGGILRRDRCQAPCP
ncbi:hypothetical protein HPP92_027755 [Vanilla planifolia]|uniref:ZF-HD dimerization-type domain-containing protein n=1 Tax=Vanilla planifolia TaxID=51239 RepID=A0A835PBB9_VANPL|nr:hypothetical protein HPP92_027755 [Vanilla planifolia]